MAEKYQIKVIAGNASVDLANEICRCLGVNPVERVLSKFNDGETNVEIKESLRGADVFIVQSTSHPVNDHLMELLLLIHTAKLASAARVTAVIPYFGYARQDRKTKPRVPISASFVAQLIETSGADRVLTMDLHCGQIQGFFHRIPVDNLNADVILCPGINTLHYDLSKMVVVSPDAGGVERARRFADRMNASSVATILKRRVEAGKVESMQLVGDVKDATCWIVDDIVDSAGTLCAAAQLLKDHGARDVFAVCSHAVLSGQAKQRVENSCISQIITTNTIDNGLNSTPWGTIIFDEKMYACSSPYPKFTYFSIAMLFAQAIGRIHYEKSISELFSK